MKGPLGSPVFVRLLIFETLCQFGMAMVNPVVSTFAVTLGATATLAGFVAGLNPLSAMALRPLGGLVFDRLTKKSSLLLAAIVAASSSLVCATFSTMPSLVISRVVLGASFVVKSSVVVSLASLVVPRDKVGQGVGMIGLAYTVAYALAPGIGSWIGEGFGYRATFFVSAALFVGAICLAASIKTTHASARKERELDDASGSEAPRSRRLGVQVFFHVPTIPFAIVAIFETLIQGTMISLLLLVAADRGVEGASVFFLVYAAVTVAVRPFSSRLYDKYGMTKVLYPEAVVMSLCPFVLVFAYDLPLFLVAAVALAIGQGSLHPCFQAESVRGVDPNDAALAANTFYMGSDVGMALGPIVCGAVLQAFGSTAMLVVCTGMGIMLIVAYSIYRRTRGGGR